MSDGELRGSDFMYLAIGGILAYGAYKFFKTGSVFSTETPQLINNPTAPISTTGMFDFSPPTDYKIGQLPTLKQAALIASPVGSIETGIAALKSVFSSNPKTQYVDPYIPGAPNFTTTTGQSIFVDKSGQLPNFSSMSGQSVYIAPPSSPVGKSVTTQITTKTTPKSSVSTTGAKVGTVFASGASVKSVGASGKYRTYL